MKDDNLTPEQVLAALFKGLSRFDQMALLSRLEFTGGSMYRAWAASERNAKAREALLAAAQREDDSANLLKGMTTLKAACEKCAKPLPLDAAALTCSFQCTFCPDCAARMDNLCPNCSGELAARHAHG
ncbi:MAG TPA: DUF1272 domain-containing protein [Candidatus Binataceae bacterium]|nr:DUF1272 domain-containing protein [Candidatus Binataceae bacterium]